MRSTHGSPSLNTGKMPVPPGTPVTGKMPVPPGTPVTGKMPVPPGTPVTGKMPVPPGTCISRRWHRLPACGVVAQASSLCVLGSLSSTRSRTRPGPAFSK
ncbi:MAG: hypothetical protein FJ291_11715 [Planctomycetes bacterium]|nr:hypothetical protein [Planctomycetota bacterium]